MDEVEIDDRGNETDIRSTYSILPPYYRNQIGLEKSLVSNLENLKAARKHAHAQRGRGSERRRDLLIPYAAVVACLVVGVGAYAITSSKYSLSSPMASIHQKQDDQAGIVRPEKEAVQIAVAPIKKPPAEKQVTVVKTSVVPDIDSAAEVKKAKQKAAKEKEAAEMAAAAAAADDYFSGVKGGATLKISSYWSDGNKVDFILWIIHGNLKEKITADDLRVMGWAIVLRRRLVVLRKGKDIVRVPV